MKIYFVRHAEPEYNLLQKDRGECPGPTLSINGLKQAKNLATQLSQLKFDFIYCSDLSRTRQTIKPLCDTTNQVLFLEPRIRETADVINNYLDHNDFSEPESDQLKRLDSFLEQVVCRHIKKNENNILIVSHFNTIEYLSKALGNHIKKPEYAKIYCIDVPNLVVIPAVMT